MLEAIIDAIRTRPADTRLVLLSDFDGTLADFHDNPVMPWPTRETQRLLAMLTERPDVSFGVVSGRRLEDVRARTVLSDRAYFAGLHGLEIGLGDVRWTHPQLATARAYVHRLAHALHQMPGHVPGLFIEDKDASVAVHLRRVRPEDREAAEALVDGVATPFIVGGEVRRLSGQLVVEFLPNVAWDKGGATRWIARDVETRFGQPVFVVFIGDDKTDEDAFQAIERGFGVLVGRRASAARFQLNSTREVTSLLAWLAGDA
jgi:trehalose 6-phosphate phosphatase